MYTSQAEGGCRAVKTDLERQGKVTRDPREPIKMMAAPLSETRRDLARRWVGHVLEEELLKRNLVTLSTCPLLCDLKTPILMKACQV